MGRQILPTLGRGFSSGNYFLFGIRVYCILYVAYIHYSYVAYIHYSLNPSFIAFLFLLINIQIGSSRHGFSHGGQLYMLLQRRTVYGWLGPGEHLVPTQAAWLGILPL
jgi:hypothetical protein